ncbi:T9SS type A sorting domain-containing protein [Ferruginibacter paludis]|uniref:T9SS type A sorting domain-containing protein n=1 Tax=Ferruginibacter paludis TaxID=1310417 RepID=UPI0025B3EEF2|nr:T9SS type A sorting domain-containing protein [Ferruginibacter paludis]MDN3657296.1 T9SS type A sorting domain-containing protein [Ferruginibacter paludis]
MKFIPGLVLLLLLPTMVANAQRRCGTAYYIQQLIKADAGLGNSINKAEAQIKAVTSKAAGERDIVADEIIYLPVVIHVLYNTGVQNISLAQIQSQLTVLNNDYSNLNADKVNTPAVFSALAADTKIRFCLAQVDPQGKRTSGIIRKYTGTQVFSPEDAMKYTAQGGDDAWDCKRYLNIWVCDMGGRTLGYSSVPGGPAATDGVVVAYDVFGSTGNVRSPYDKGRTATHETGHWLGLKHVWGDAVCGSDEVDDTPTQQYYNYGCPSFPHVSNCSPDGNGDMFMNFMDFANDACMSLFTNGQKARMRALFEKDNIRNSFLTSFACDSTLVQASPVITVDTIAVAKPVIGVNIYPNPMQSNVTIECASTLKSATLKTINIYNVSGSKVYTSTFNSAKTTISVATLAKGIYIFSVEEGANRFTKKLIKQ